MGMLPIILADCEAVTSIERIELRDGGLLLYVDVFLTPGHADRYFENLRDHCKWEQKPGIFGCMQPRLIASYGDEGLTYKYSGVEYDTHQLQDSPAGSHRRNANPAPSGSSALRTRRQPSHVLCSVNYPKQP